MVNKIYEMKNQIIERIESDIKERGVDRIDVQEVGKLVDMVKDLAEAEASCWEAEYYKNVTKAMSQGSSGYGSGGGSASSGGRSGYGSTSGYGSSTMSRQGYQSGPMGHDSLIEKLGEEYQNLNAQDRMMMKNKVLTVLGAM